MSMKLNQFLGIGTISSGDEASCFSFQPVLDKENKKDVTGYVASFFVAVKKEFMDRNGQKKTDQALVLVSHYIKAAEKDTFLKKFKMGDAVFFMGQIRPSEDGGAPVFEADTPEEYSAFDVEAKTLRFLARGEQVKFVEPFVRWMIAGNLGRDPESRFTSSGEMVTSLNIASAWKGVGADGKFTEETVWIRGSFWGESRVKGLSYFKKGSGIYIDALPKYEAETGGPRIWESKGRKGASYEVTVLDYGFTSSKNDNNGTSNEEPEYPVEGMTDADIPL